MLTEKNGYPVYPLSVAQKFHFFYMDYCPMKSVVNIGNTLTIETELDFAELKKAIYKAIDRCESMRLRLTQDEDGTWYQYVVEHEDRDIEFVDFSDISEDEANAIMTGWTQVPIVLKDSPLNRIVMIKMPGGYSGIYALTHHLTMDAQALFCFYKDIIELYCSEMYEGIDAPGEMASYIEQLKKDLAYEAGSKAQQRDREYFQKLIEESEPIYVGIDGTKKLDAVRAMDNNPNARAAYNTSDSVQSKLDVFHLEAEPTERLVNFCEEYHVSLNFLLLMGLRTYFQKENGIDDVSINSAIARRATLKEKHCGGTRIHSFPFRTIISKDTKFIDAVCEIRDKQTEMFRHANYNPVEYFAYRAKCYPQPQGRTYEPISLTYQPASLKQKGLDKLGDIKYKTKWLPNGATTQGVYLTVMHRPEDNGMDFCFEHQKKAVSTKQLEYMYYYMCKILFKGVANPEMTVGEIIESV